MVRCLVLQLGRKCQQPRGYWVLLQDCYIYIVTRLFCYVVATRKLQLQNWYMGVHGFKSE